MNKVRLDYKLEAAVNKGVASMLLRGIRAGIKVMKDDRAPEYSIARVILRPESHRASGWKH